MHGRRAHPFQELTVRYQQRPRGGPRTTAPEDGGTRTPAPRAFHRGRTPTSRAFRESWLNSELWHRCPCGFPGISLPYARTRPLVGRHEGNDGHPACNESGRKTPREHPTCNESGRKPSEYSRRWRRLFNPMWDAPALARSLAFPYRTGAMRAASPRLGRCESAAASGHARDEGKGYRAWEQGRSKLPQFSAV